MDCRVGPRVRVHARQVRRGVRLLCTLRAAALYAVDAGTLGPMAGEK